MPGLWQEPRVPGERSLLPPGSRGTFLLAMTLAVVVDVLLVTSTGAALALTVIEIALLVPWAVLSWRMARKEPRQGGGPLGSRVGVYLRDILLGALVVLLLAEKVLLIESLGARAEIGPYLAPYRLYTVVAYGLVVLSVMLHVLPGWVLRALSDHPARMMALTFGVAGLLGAVLLNLPQSLRDVRDASWINGLFTATSAVCVTGLNVHHVAQTYTPLGQLLLLGLIQIGGLGIMVLSAAFVIIAGRRLRARAGSVLVEVLDASSVASLRRAIKGIVLYALVVEVLGAVVLWVCFSAYPEVALGPQPAIGTSMAHPALAGAGSVLWAALFHSVSAFCNAGFSLFEGGLVPFVGSWAVCSTVMLLITIGGIGFPVIDELTRGVQLRWRGHRPRRLSLHSRTVLVMTGLLLGGVFLAFLALEWTQSLAGRAIHERLLAAIFSAVTPRTAGFNTIDFGATRVPTQLLLCMAMFVGASPGSTGGGIKTTTLAALLAAFRAEAQRSDRPQLLDRALSPATMRRALGVFFFSAVAVTGSYFLLLLTDSEKSPIALVFEAFSAFGTVGLSTGITPALSPAGRLVIAATMYLGRIGPLTAALALAGERHPRYTLPEERISIG